MPTTRRQDKMMIESRFLFVGTVVAGCVMAGALARGQDTVPIQDVELQPLPLRRSNEWCSRWTTSGRR